MKHGKSKAHQRAKEKRIAKSRWKQRKAINRLSHEEIGRRDLQSRTALGIVAEVTTVNPPILGKLKSKPTPRIESYQGKVIFDKSNDFGFDEPKTGLKFLLVGFMTWLKNLLKVRKG